MTTPTPSGTQAPSFPASFRTQRISTNGVTLHVRVGGTGPAVLLLHGFGETGDMWVPVAAALVNDHTVIVPDLRGMGLSSQSESGYDKKTQAHDIAGLLDSLNVTQIDLVTHDIGNMVGYAFAAEFPARVRRLVLIDAPIPGMGPWEDIIKGHKVWHFSFWGPDEERLVAGRERIYLDRFWNEFAATRTAFPEALRVHYAEIYARPGAMHAAFSQFEAFDQDVIDNRAFLAKGKLTMPVLALGGDKSYAQMMPVIARAVATNVEAGVIPNSGHWITEENPDATAELVTAFLSKA